MIGGRGADERTAQIMPMRRLAAAILFLGLSGGGLCLHSARAHTKGSHLLQSDIAADGRTADKTESPSFEVVSVKKDSNDANMVRLGGPDVSRFTAANVSAKTLIEFSYNFQDFQLSGGPSWMDSEKFDIDGKVEDSLAQQLRALPQVKQQDQMRLMVRSLLADRFKLRVSHSTKILPVFALVIAKGGPKLRAVDPPDTQSAPFPAPPTPGGPATLPPGEVMISLFTGGKATMAGKAASMANLAKMLGVQLGRHVNDETGLTGSYDFLLSYTRDSTLGGVSIVAVPSPTSAENPGGVSIFTAIQEQLGLKLQSTKGPVDTIVINHIEEPSAN